jgi:hypothetical protein
LAGGNRDLTLLLCPDNNPDDNAMTTRFLPLALLLLGTAGCQAFDRAAGTDTSGVYPSQRNGTPVNPPGTAATRALDRAAGTDTSGAYPSQRDGTPSNPPGTAATRTYDRATGSNTSGAYPANTRPY